MAEALTAAIAVLTAVQVLFQDYSDLRSKYAESFRESALLLQLVEPLVTAPRVSERLQPLVLDVVREVTRLQRHAERYRAAGRARRLLYALRKDPEAVAAKLRTVSSNLSVMLKIKNQSALDAMFDSAAILHCLGEECQGFWDRHFGKDVRAVAFDDLTQALENQFRRRITGAETLALEAILDLKLNGKVSIYEYARWLRKFGPIGVATEACLESLYDKSTGAMLACFWGEIFHEHAQAALADTRLEIILRYGEDDNSDFYLDFTDARGAFHELVVTREADGFAAAAPPPDGGDRVAREIFEGLCLSVKAGKQVTPNGAQTRPKYASLRVLLDDVRHVMGYRLGNADGDDKQQQALGASNPVAALQRERAVRRRQGQRRSPKTPSASTSPPTTASDRSCGSSHAGDHSSGAGSPNARMRGGSARGSAHTEPCMTTRGGATSGSDNDRPLLCSPWRGPSPSRPRSQPPAHPHPPQKLLLFAADEASAAAIRRRARACGLDLTPMSDMRVAAAMGSDHGCVFLSLAHPDAAAIATHFRRHRAGLTLLGEEGQEAAPRAMLGANVRFLPHPHDFSSPPPTSGDAGAAAAAGTAFSHGRRLHGKHRAAPPPPLTRP